ncbi:hypothetical protein [Streptomyces sp. NPDC002690]
MSSVGSVSLRVSPDVTRFGQELAARLRAESTSFTVPIAIDRASLATFRAQVANLVRPQQVDINVNLQGEASARTRLDALAQSRTSNVRVDVDRSAANTIGRITSAAGSALGTVAGLGSKLALLGSAAPAVGAIANVVAAIAPAAALALPAVAALGSAVGAIKLGTTGLGDAFKEAFSPAASGASGAASATRQVEQAQRGLADAQRAVGDARRAAAEQVANANRAVVSAERDLSDAQRDAKSAQEDLTGARRDATRELEDMSLRLQGSRLDEKEAVLRVQEAEEALKKVQLDPRSSDLQRAQAQLRVDEAKQGLKEQRVETQRLAKDTEAANKAGVEGSDRVKDAKDRLAEANRNVADKAQGVRDAETAVAKAQSDGARQVADAQRSVADASRALADAQTASAAQTAKLSESFSKLSPNAQGFVNAVKGLKPSWDAMQLGVQDRLFAGLGGRLSDVGSRVIPILRGGLEGTAGVLNRMAKGALDAVNNLAKTGMLRQIFDGATRSLSPLSRIPGQLVTGFGQVAVAAQPAFQRITEGVSGVADGVAAKLSKAFESGAMEKAIDTAVSLLGDLMDVAGNVVSILGDVFMAGADSGGGTIGMLKTITEEISKITSSPEVQGGLKALFDVMGTLATTVAPLLGTALKFVGEIFQKLGPPIETVVQALGDALAPVIDALGPVLVVLADVVGKILIALSPLLVVLGNLIATALKPLGPIFAIIGGLIQKLAPIIAVLASTVGQILTPILEGLGAVLTELVTQYADQFLKLLETLLPVIPELIPPLLGVAKSLGDLLLAIAPLLPQILLLTTQLVVALLPALLPLLPPILQLVDLLVRLAVWAIKKFVLPAIQDFIGYVKDMGHKLQPFIDAVKHVTEWIRDKFQWLHDKLIGPSGVPDLINGIAGWFSRGKAWIKKIWDEAWANTIGRATSAAKAVGERVSRFASSVRDGFTDAKHWVTDRWSSMWSSVSDRVTSMRKTVEGKVRDFKDSIVGFFVTAVSGVKTAWDKLQAVAKSPVKFMIETVFNKGIAGVWNSTAAKLPGIGKISEMKLPQGFASGGVLPGYTPGLDVHRFVSPTGGTLDLSGGEGILRPEVTRVVGKSGIDTLNAAAREGGVQGVRNVLSSKIPHQAFAGGGIFGSIWDTVSDNPVTGAVGDILGKGADWARGGVADLAEKALKALLGPLKTPTMAHPDWTDLIRAVPTQFAAKMVSFIRGKEDAGAGSEVALKGYKPSAGVAQWSSVVLQSLKEVGEPASLLNTTLRRMNQESGGNPTIVNKWDGNWQAGHPSVGLMQVIGPTFRSYAGKYKNKGPFLYGTSVDPLANVYSSMRYAKAAYGSLSRAYDRPGGYDNGGWLPTGVSTVVNQTGEPEAILNPQQWQSMVTLAEQAKRGQARGHQITVNNPPQPTAEKQIADAMYRSELLGR